MSLAAISLEETLRTDFVRACAALAQAKRARQAKDTPAARAWVDECTRRVDAVLDEANGRSWDRD